jgi:hypothetical protein
MNDDQFDIDHLVSRGLSYDVVNQKSDDFNIVYRYGDNFWDVNWLEHNGVFAWHIDTHTELKIKTSEISEMTLYDLSIEIDKGNNPFKTIRLEEENW